MSSCKKATYKAKQKITSFHVFQYLYMFISLIDYLFNYNFYHNHRQRFQNAEPIEY